ncbi:MAG: hypothetical protein IPM57_03940 [Oligoflexia bacterium]|nr:hypothetical protein [Oligoflexia bacterium]
MESNNENIEQTKSSQLSKKIIDKLNLEQVVFFKDEYGDAYCFCTINNASKAYPIRGSDFQDYIRHFVYIHFSRGLSRQTLEEICCNLEAKAKFTGNEHALHVRVAQHENGFYYDLGTNYVKISDTGWEIGNTPLILFKKYPIMKNQVCPESGGNINKLFDFVNVKNKDQQVLILTFLISSFIPEIGHPILILSGPQGSAKSSCLRYLCRIIDPCHTSDIELINSESFMQAASHRWVIPLDNLRRLKDNYSDLLCKLVTGAGHSKRRLYTDDDDIIYKLKRVLILNGINLPVENPDALDRSLIIELERVTEENRKEELLLEQDFSQALPQLLGACFDVLSKAMAIKPTIILKNKKRMADFVVWGCAIAKALGFSEDDFLSAYDKNIKISIEESLDASPVGVLLLCYLEKYGSIEGTPTRVLEMLKLDMSLPHIDERLLPRTGRSFGRKLQELKPNLEFLGYEVVRNRGKERIIHIFRKKSENNDENVVTTTTNGQSRHYDDNDISFENFDADIPF